MARAPEQETRTPLPDLLDLLAVSDCACGGCYYYAVVFGVEGDVGGWGEVVAAAAAGGGREGGRVTWLLMGITKLMCECFAGDEDGGLMILERLRGWRWKGGLRAQKRLLYAHARLMGIPELSSEQGRKDERWLSLLWVGLLWVG